MEIYNYHFTKSKELAGAIFEDNGYFHACTATESSHTFKTRKGAEKWLAKRNYVLTK